ncbi:MAG: hypothetical protein M1575_02885 [Patescibacteria group bacterium]|nr:hypothetical protein [Patescibacteria group bacterium]MCL5095650.1 hypothetical protein [Patescibacteria group bacterium]
MPSPIEAKSVVLVLFGVDPRTGNRTVSPKTRQCPQGCLGNRAFDPDKQCYSGMTKRGFNCDGKEIVPNPSKNI